MDADDEIRDVFGAEPAEAPPPVDWAEVESALGLRLPRDYRWLAETYGAGGVDDFLFVCHPAVANPYMNLTWHAVEDLDILRDVIELEDEPPPHKPDSVIGGLLPWGFTGNSDLCLWHVRSEDPETWTVVLREGAGEEWYEFDGGLVAFLAALLAGRETVPFLPGNFPGDPPQWAAGD